MITKKRKRGSYSLWAHAWHRMKRNKIAMAGLMVIALTTFISLMGSLIRPDGTEHANDQKLQLGKKHPGFSVQMLKVKKNKPVKKVMFFQRMLFGGQESEYKTVPIFNYEYGASEIKVEEYTGNNETYEGKQIPYLLVDVVYALDVNHNYSEDENGTVSFYTIDGEKHTENIQNLKEVVEKEHLITKRYWLGTDRFGRDMLSRLMAGALVSLAVGFISVFISVVIGILIGAIGGYFRGWVDDVIMWLINVVWSIPTLLLVIAITFALGKGFWQVFVAVGLTMWVEVARIVRGQTISLREKEFIEAGKALGFSSFRLILKHVLPNVMGPVIVISAANFANAILIEAGLSFLGIGMQPPMASWGRMIKDHYAYIVSDGAYLAILPGITIMLLVLAFMLVGNGLRDALDTKSMEEAMR